jgi:hypothetical protein
MVMKRILCYLLLFLYNYIMGYLNEIVYVRNQQ